MSTRWIKSPDIAVDQDNIKAQFGAKVLFPNAAYRAIDFRDMSTISIYFFHFIPLVHVLKHQYYVERPEAGFKLV